MTSAMSVPVTADFAPGLERAFERVPAERSYELRDVQGLNEAVLASVDDDPTPVMLSFGASF